MKKILLILILILSFQTLAKADDIRDFEIEGMSIGDSLLDFFDKNKIEIEKKDKYSLKYKNNEYVQIGASSNKNYLLNINSNKFDDLSIILKTIDNTYKIYSIGGRIFCEKDIYVCKSKKKEIVKELTLFFDDNVEIINKTKKHSADPTGNSNTFNTYFNFESEKGYISVSVYDWSKENNKKDIQDNLKIMIISGEFDDFLNNVQYTN
jgi:hypothetical protein